MLGRAVSSINPTDFHPSSVMGCSERPATNSHTYSPGPAWGWPYIAVGMHSAVHSSMGWPSISSSASWMVGFLTPAEVRRSPRTRSDCSDGGQDAKGWCYLSTDKH